MRVLRWSTLIVLFGILFAGCGKGDRYDDRGDLQPGFCRQWNPDFDYNGKRCAFNLTGISRKKVKGCNLSRRQFSYCGDMTPTQVSYSERIKHSREVDALTLISNSSHSDEQAFLSVNDGFLVEGRRVIPTPYNHLALRFPTRCTNFGTDPMAGMLEWLGHEIGRAFPGKKFSGVKLVIGDVAAPRGGCLWGHNQRVCHKSHKNGLDADVGYLLVKPGQSSPIEFHQIFDAKVNYWFLKKVFHNPYVCIKFIFLDRRNIQKLAHVAGNDPEWKVMRRFIQHAAGHHNHFHIRIGSAAGAPGCVKSDLQVASFSRSR